MARESAAPIALESEPQESTKTEQPSPEGPAPATGSEQVPVEERTQRVMSFLQVLREGSDEDLQKRFADDFQAIIRRYPEIETEYCCLGILEPDDGIDEYEVDRIFNALQSENSKKDRNILLTLLSPGGQIEPAYQISKLCKAYAKDKFVAVVPRKAKSAATLLALGADEIHMGPLGQLGPIDPQLGGLPALGVSQELNRIASVAEHYPKSSDMLARYLRLVLSVEQIGYCERISESAEQYAQRLLARKTHLKATAATIAHDLVHTYKDHSFVIDVEEAREHLGPDWVREGTNELQFIEEVYAQFRVYNLFLQKKRLVVIGDLKGGALLWRKDD